MPKIVLIQPRSSTWGIGYLPLGLLCLGTILDKNKYEVTIIDSNFETSYSELFSKAVKETSLVGITVNTAQVGDAIQISKAVKKLTSAPLVWGGWHATLFSEQTVDDELVDFVVSNEGEFTLLELVEALESGSDFKNIKGLTYKENGNIKSNPRRDYINLENLPPVKYDLCNLSQYSTFSFRRMITYESSRGCPYRCSFCINSVTNNRKYRMKNAGKVVDEIEEIVKRFNVNYIHFVDDNFFLDIDRVRAICDGFIRRNLNINWFGECRADNFRKGYVDEDFLKLAQSSGLVKLTIGAESGSERMLDLIDKDISVDNILKSAEMLGKYNIVPSYGFIIGLPGEAREDVIDTLRLVDRLKKLCPQMKFGINTFRAYPRCKITNGLVSNGIIREPKSLREWNKKKNLKIYIGNNKQAWQWNPGFVYSIAYFSQIAHSVYDDKEMRNILRHFVVYKLPDVLFIHLARLRMKYHFFLLPVDRLLYKSYKSMLEKLKHIVRALKLENKIRTLFGDV